MKLEVFVSMIGVGLAAFADPSITEVTAVQRYPWNGKVDITYKVSGIESAAKQNGWLTTLKVTATDKQSGTTYTATSLTGDTSVADGTHAVVWDMSAQGLTFKSTNVLFDVTCETKQALYCVVDLSGGTSAASYPVSYLSDVPSGGWKTEHKTTKLVLRYIAPGSFKMNGSYDVTLTKRYYIGVFEVTQKQYELITGSNPSTALRGDERPVDTVTWKTIKDGFITSLSTKSGLTFDLPSEAQWEYACRAGTTTKYSCGNNPNSAYMNYYIYGVSGSAISVGTLLANAWELYDMHGNVKEWCRDWYGDLKSATDPEGVTSGSCRVVRGGSSYTEASGCTSSSREGLEPTKAYYTNGFRCSRTIQ